MSRCGGASSVTSRSAIRIVPPVIVSRPADRAQQRRLAAAGRADQDHELAVPDRQADVVDRDARPSRTPCGRSRGRSGPSPRNLARSAGESAIVVTHAAAIVVRRRSQPVSSASHPGHVQRVRPRGRATRRSLVDFGSGAVLDHARRARRRARHGRPRHAPPPRRRQGLARAAAAGIRIWVPPVERELFDARRRAAGRPGGSTTTTTCARTGSRCSSRCRSTASFASTARGRYGDVEAYALPTPGHTVGSVTYLVELDGRAVAFTGDLVHGAGKVWSLAATQWSYSGIEGLAATFFSCGVLAGREPDLLAARRTAIRSTSRRRRWRSCAERIAGARRRCGSRIPGTLRHACDDPWAESRRTCSATGRASRTAMRCCPRPGAALLIDFGYDIVDRARRRHGASRRGGRCSRRSTR